MKKEKKKLIVSYTEEGRLSIFSQQPMTTRIQTNDFKKII